jgi:1-aminocyclopropane-1-carboxylate deaminase/D-cysteine desulfhydrase-like pyridoxal-dependent ACC family enzyme
MAESSRRKSTTGAASAPTIPLVRRYPRLATLPRVSLGEFPTPVESLRLDDETALWIKRDDLAGDTLGGNKLRALEFLLAGVREGDVVLTAGGVGSTHVLATAHHARALGARCIGIRWKHDMNPTALEVSARASELCERVGDSAGPARAIARALVHRVATRAHWVPMGGSSPLGILGHVNAALELAEQIARGELPRPERLVVPLGTGGTAAGLALGFRIAGLDTIVVGARVVPRIAGNRWRVLRLASATARLLERLSGERVPRILGSRLRVVHDAYGGAYGRALTGAATATHIAALDLGVRLDATYSAKAFAVALNTARHERGTTLFWLTFDARWMRPLGGGERT